MVTKINFPKCTGCFTCVDVCPEYVYEEGDGQPIIAYPQRCGDCEDCISECPENAISKED